MAPVRLIRCPRAALASLASASLLLAAALFPAITAAQRLPEDVLPQHYSLKLTPDMDRAAFSGDERIDVTLLKPASSITLNATEIGFDGVSAGQGGENLPARVSLNSAAQQATFHFAQTLRAGPLTLRIRFHGTLNPDLRGFYLSKTAGHKYAVTQFEPTDARRAFPCFDEPAFKATFDVTLVAPGADMAISNTNIVSDTPGPKPTEHTVRFATTPKMSTYLVAFLVGDFQCVSGSSDGTPIRVCSPPSEANDGRFALKAAEFFLSYYNGYFGIKYPMPKLDLIAIPDFEAGAMENFGAITFRETLLLLDPAEASVGQQKNVAMVVAHEMAHQWFGDMVTMQWWNNIWLNEGFATWMENKAVAQWRPDWNTPQDAAVSLNAVLNTDSQATTRTIRAEANTPDEINEMFDAITYQKGGAVLAMVENYLGDETFRRGVHGYLEAHMYANATAEDFWNAQTAESRQPVDKIMESFVTQPGAPLLTFGAVRGGEVKVSQRRFFIHPPARTGAYPDWTIPVCLEDAGERECQVLDRSWQKLPAPAGAVLFGDAGGRGYYRSRYNPEEFQKLAGGLEEGLTPVDRIALLGSQWALTRAAETRVGDFMLLASRVKDDASPEVIDTVSSAIYQIDREVASTPAERAQLQDWVRATFHPPFSRLGRGDPAAAPAQEELRAALFAFLGRIGLDPAVISESKDLANRYLDHPASVDPNLAGAALEISAENGDAAFYDRVLRANQTASDPQRYSRTLVTLGLFRNPALVERTLRYAVSGEVRNQDSISLVTMELSSRWTQDEAWSFVEANWPQVKAQITPTSGERLVAATGSFCTDGKAREIASFFGAHPVAASQRELTISQEEIGDCVALRAKQGANLKRWLSRAKDHR